MEEKKPHKERADKYETKVAVKGTFEDMIKAALKERSQTKLLMTFVLFNAKSE